jgi:hypothetical protein
MKWKSLLLPSILVIILGGLAGFIANLYFSQHPILISSEESAYNVLRDVTMIVIAALTIFTAVLIVIVGWALRGILFNDLKSELSEIIEESRNNLCSSLHGKVAPLWGRLFEYDKESTYLIEYAVGEARQALDYAKKLDEKKHWGLQTEARNNYLMALAERGDPGDTNEAYRMSIDQERLLTEHEGEIERPIYQSRKETIYFVRCRFPRIHSNDREKAIQDFNSMKDCSNFGKWQKRWVDFGLIKDTNPDKLS